MPVFRTLVLWALMVLSGSISAQNIWFTMRPSPVDSNSYVIYFSPRSGDINPPHSVYNLSICFGIPVATNPAPAIVVTSPHSGSILDSGISTNHNMNNAFYNLYYYELNSWDMSSNSTAAPYLQNQLYELATIKMIPRIVNGRVSPRTAPILVTIDRGLTHTSGDLGPAHNFINFREYMYATNDNSDFLSDAYSINGKNYQPIRTGPASPGYYGNTFTLNPGLNASMPLPVTLLYFNCSAATNHTVMLAWAATNPEPTVRYTVERMNTDGSYHTLFQSTTETSATFKFTDQNPLNGNNYYRLKIQEADGRISYSGTCTSIVEALPDERVQLFPNPVQNEIWIQYPRQTLPSEVKFYIIDRLGRTVQTHTVSIPAGTNTSRIPASTLDPGPYFIRFSLNDKRNTIKFIKE